VHLFFATCTHRSFSFFLLFIHIIYIKKIESASLAHFCRKKGRGVVLCRFKDWKPAVYFLFVLPLFKPKCFKKVHLLPLPHLPPFLGGGGGREAQKNAVLLKVVVFAVAHRFYLCRCAAVTPSGALRLWYCIPCAGIV